MYKILVTGANGQLGLCLKELSELNKTLFFTFLTKEELDITNEKQIKNTFVNSNFDYCINCAAYTAVDKAEEDKEKAFYVNVMGVRYLSRICKNFNTILIHISTDYVFDGENNRPYKETDITNPISVYGLTKLQGEKEVMSNTNAYFIIRTSWLYSEYGSNFVKTILNLYHKKKELKIINDQIGTPTYAKDVAKILLDIIKLKNTNFGVYNLSNEGVASWYDFANAIFELKDIKIDIKPISTESYPALAKRPFYSVLDKGKIKNKLEVEIPYWRESLKKCLDKID